MFKIGILYKSKTNWINVKEYGARGDGVTDDTTAIQEALNDISIYGGTVYFPPGVYVISNTLWVKSKTVLLGEGGRSKVSVIKRANGMYTDTIVAGVYDGKTYQRSPYIDWVGGKPYDSNNQGEGITIKGLFIDGNCDNAGQPPKEPSPPFASYRGSNIWIQWVNGVHIEDVWSDKHSNDGCWIGMCRRVTVKDCIFSNGKLINQSNGTIPTKNGLTIAGTMSGDDGDGVDMLMVHNCIFENNDDLGCAIQARTDNNGAGDFGGTIIVSNCISRNNDVYGIGIEGYEDITSNPIKGVIIEGCISDGDGKEALASVAVTYQAEDVNITNVIIRNAQNSGLIVNGHKNVTIENVKINGYAIGATQQAFGIQVYKDASVPSNLEFVTIHNCLVRGGAGRSVNTLGISASGMDQLFIEGCKIEGTTYINGLGEGIYASGKITKIDGCDVSKCATSGIYVSGLVYSYQVTNCKTYNNGQNTSQTNRRGIFVGDSSIGNRYGTISGNHSFDNQATPTQQYGIQVPNGSSEFIDIFGNKAWGNINGALNGEISGSKNKVWGNDFDQNSKGLVIHGNGYWNGNRIKLGYFSLWVDTSGRLRIKNGDPVSETDGVVVGTQA